MDRDETEVLLKCLGYGEDAAKKETAKDVLPEEWRNIAAIAGRHRVAPLLYHQLNRMGIALPNDVSESLKRAYRQNVMRNMQLYNDLGRLIERLSVKNIDIIVLKGAYLASEVYGDIGLRIMSDIDLLAKKEDLGQIEQEMIDLGFEPLNCNREICEDNKHFEYCNNKTSSTVEIHWAILDPSYKLNIDLDGLRARVRQVKIVKNQASALSTEDLVLHLCLHTAVHSHDMRIGMFCDFGEIIKQYGHSIRWDLIAAEGKRWGITKPTYFILRLVREMLDVPVPSDWLCSMKPDDFDEQLISMAHAHIARDRIKTAAMVSKQTSLFWGSKGLAGKFSVVRKRLLLPRKMMALKYPASSDSWRIYLYYPLHIMGSLFRNGAAIGRLVGGDKRTINDAERATRVWELRNWLLSG